MSIEDELARRQISWADRKKMLRGKRCKVWVQVIVAAHSVYTTRNGHFLATIAYYSLPVLPAPLQMMVG